MVELILSERQKPRALATLREIYGEHNSLCAEGAQCSRAKQIKRLIEKLEREDRAQKHAASA